MLNPKCACGTPSVVIINTMWRDGISSPEPYCFACLEDEWDGLDNQCEILSSQLQLKRDEREKYAKAIRDYEFSLRQPRLPFED